MAITQPCLILAGGLGTRLRAVIGERPKCLAPVGRRTFLKVLVERLAEAGVTEIVLSLGYRAELVVESLSGEELPLPIRYVVESSLLGTGGAIAFALDTLRLDECLVTNGDTYLDGDLSQMLMPLDRAAGELFRMATVDVSDRSRFGGVEGDQTGHLRRFLEKGKHESGAINAGFYRLCRAALPENRVVPYSLEVDLLPLLVAKNAVTLTRITGSFTDIGIPTDYETFCRRHAN